jgi:hypothetical protein
MKINVKGDQPLNLLGLLICASVELGKEINKGKLCRQAILVIEINLAIHELLSVSKDNAIREKE